MEKNAAVASGRSWFMLSLSLLTIVIMYISYIGYSISSLDIMDELGLNYTQIGSLASMSALTGGISVLFAWIFINKYGAKRISIFSLLTCAVGLLMFAYAQSYEMLLLSRALQGVGIAVCFNAPYSFATNWFENTKNLAACTGLLMAADGVGTFTTLYLYTFVIQVFGWRSGAIAGAGIVLACAVIFAVVAREAPTVTYGIKAEIGLRRKYRDTIKEKNVIPAGLFIIGLWGSYGVAVYWVPTLLMEDAGWLESTAGLTGSLYALAGIVSAIGLGIVSDRLGKRKIIIIFSGIVFTASFVLAAIGVAYEMYLLLAISLPLSGFAAYAGQPLCYALAVEKLDSDQVSIAYGFIMAVGLLFGALVYPLALGAIKDLTGNYVVGFSAVAVSLLLLNVIAVFFMKDFKPEDA